MSNSDDSINIYLDFNYPKYDFEKQIYFKKSINYFLKNHNS
jgi:hypothetical protein